jgi:primosomal protein N' (replication factor Y)
VNLRLEGPDHDPVEANAKALARKLRGQQSGVEILGPAPAPIVRLRNRYRWQILLKCKETGPLLRLAAQAREWLPRSRAARLHVDVDPYSML